MGTPLVFLVCSQRTDLSGVLVSSSALSLSLLLCVVSVFLLLPQADIDGAPSAFYSTSTLPAP